MALQRRSTERFRASIWPGFVDAMTGLLLVLMFVLTIFMVIQFALRETISGQENRLNQLTAEIASLTDALGLERDRAAALGAQVGTLSGELAEAQSDIATQSNLIAQLTAERDAQTAALAQAENRITGYEAQVAGLLAQRRENEATIADLEARRETLLSEQEALNLALAQARDEIDAQTEQARLAAARREALEALVAQLEAEGETSDARISELEAARLADAAAAEALRERLQDADAELTAMSLALEEKRQEAEDTLTLLAAARAAREELDATLAQLQADQTETEARLLAALAAKDSTESELEAARAALAEAQLTEAELGELRNELAAALLARDEARALAEQRLTEAERQAALLAMANATLSEEEALSAESQRQMAALNEQVATLRAEMQRLQGLLDLAEDADVQANVQIESLTQDLNTAMARALLAERRQRELEQAEAERLAAEAEQLERFRSDFFGRLRDVVEGQEGVRIEGDRFVFSSEVLFEPGRAELSDAGRLEIAKVADILRSIADEIPDDIDWIIRVDGHTDNVPLSGLGEFADNWELSQARALSVVRYMEDFLAIPPERLSANGFGQYQPIAAGDSDAARAQNRRIELKLTER